MIEGVRQALERGFIRETQANLRYLFFAQSAEEEAKTASEREKLLFLEAAHLFRRVAEDEAGHVHNYLMALGEIEATPQNLLKAVEYEQNDSVEYAISASAARVEGLEEVAKTFEQIAKTEEIHAELYSSLSKKLQDLWLNDRLKRFDLSGNKPA